MNQAEKKSKFTLVPSWEQFKAWSIPDQATYVAFLLAVFATFWGFFTFFYPSNESEITKELLAKYEEKVNEVAALKLTCTLLQRDTAQLNHQLKNCGGSFDDNEINEALDAVRLNSTNPLILGRVAYIEGRYEEAAKYISQSAIDGDPLAQALLAGIYRENNEIEKALEWYTKSASQKSSIYNMHARAALGMIYYYGSGVPIDYDQAFRWCQKAAMQGEKESQLLLGSMYREGKGTGKNFAKALEWYTKSANQGQTGAQGVLGRIYYDGVEVPKDMEKAIFWYEKASIDNRYAQHNLALLYYHGEGVDKNHEKAFRLFSMAVENGDQASYVYLGIMYDEGEGINQNDQQALEWYEKAAQTGDAYAKTRLAQMHYNGEGTAKNPSLAFDLFQEAADLGDTTAIYNLAVMYYNGEIVPANKKVAIDLFKKAAQLGDKSSKAVLVQLGEL